MKSIDISKHTKFSLEFVFSEANKLADQILKSISENRNKSFFLFSLILSIFSFSFIKVVETEYTYMIVLVGCFVSGIFLRKNLFPSTITPLGALPENLLSDYFNKYENETKEKEFLATQIQNYNQAMKDNRTEMLAMVKRFKESVFVILVTFFLFGFIYLFCFIKCLPC